MIYTFILDKILFLYDLKTTFIIIARGIDITIPINPNNLPNKNTKNIENIGDILLVLLYILGDIIYSSIFGKIINTITVRRSNFLDIPIAIKSATKLVNNPPKYGIMLVILAKKPSNK